MAYFYDRNRLPRPIYLSSYPGIGERMPSQQATGTVKWMPGMGQHAPRQIALPGSGAYLPKPVGVIQPSPIYPGARGGCGTPMPPYPGAVGGCGCAAPQPAPPYPGAVGGCGTPAPPYPGAVGGCGCAGPQVPATSTLQWFNWGY